MAATGGGRLSDSSALHQSHMVHQLEDIPEISSHLSNLSKVKSKRYDQALAIIGELSLTLQKTKFKSLSPSLKDKIVYIGSEIETAWRKEPPHDLDGVPILNYTWYKVCSVLSAITNIKNALQVEAVFFGYFENAISHHLSLHRNRHITGLLDAFPKLVSHIRTAIEGDASYVFIDAEPIFRYFNSLDVSLLTAAFDRYLFTILKLSEFTTTNEFKIPIDLIPEAEAIEELMKSADESSLMILKILYVCRNEYDWFDAHQTHRNLLKPIVKIFQAKGDDVYLAKKNLIPMYHQLVVEKGKLKDKKFIDLFYQPEFLESMEPMIATPWLAEDAAAYGLVRKLEKCIELISDKLKFSHFNHFLKEKGADEMLIKICTEISRSCKHNFSELPFPISEDQPFAMTKEEFLRLKLSNYFIDLKKLIESKEEKKLVRIKIKEGKKKKSSSTKSSKGPIVICKDSKIELKKDAPISYIDEEEPKDAIETLDESFDRTYRYLDRIFMEKRVDVWTVSAEAGLEYYHFDDPAFCHELSREEMILRHRLPPQLFILAFNDHYSIKTDWFNPRTEKMCKKRECVLSINGRKYLLQATVDERSILFHYYARPINRFQDYIHETALDRHMHDASTKDASIDESPKALSFERSGFIFDDQQTVHIDFEGRHYAIAKLRL
jgi:hypothetical protein